MAELQSEIFFHFGTGIVTLIFSCSMLSEAPKDITSAINPIIGETTLQLQTAVFTINPSPLGSSSDLISIAPLNTRLGGHQQRPNQRGNRSRSIFALSQPASSSNNANLPSLFNKDPGPLCAKDVKPKTPLCFGESLVGTKKEDALVVRKLRRTRRRVGVGIGVGEV
ncbi:hypothetical protein CTheo_6886 [Ceratobasidium theobromae]|uniref:Uncharacterized protein n=1 Tax=Ceratobasidium theobromae TaxID=1582974 RepID=A0A5N5QD40_9AGAM|nr:hypothetical protein CTheo_6886 [Ceratobasidium theobromae]